MSLRQDDMPEPVAFNTPQAAAYLGFTARQLEHWRSRGGGPPYIKVGRHIRYLKVDLDAWLQGRRFDNTAGEGA